MKPLVKACLLLIPFIVVLGLVVFVFSHYTLEHKDLGFFDQYRSRHIDVALTIRRDLSQEESRPIAIVLPGNTRSYKSYTFVCDALAIKGYIVLGIRFMNDTDPPMPTIKGEPYVGRIPLMKRASEDINTVLTQIKGFFPNADTNHITFIGHSLGGDISLYYAMNNPDHVKQVVTFDNLRVPLNISNKVKVTSFRSKDPNFLPDPGVVPKKAKKGIDVENTDNQHTDFTDTGPETLKDRIIEKLNSIF
jgi:pimeloyl-ACP methyl ester carboxylesterase